MSNTMQYLSHCVIKMGMHNYKMCPVKYQADSVTLSHTEQTTEVSDYTSSSDLFITQG